jgi:hypothetical protein
MGCGNNMKFLSWMFGMKFSWFEVITLIFITIWAYNIGTWMAFLWIIPVMIATGIQKYALKEKIINARKV